MPPPAQVFPITDLPSQVHTKFKNFKETSRKLPRDFDLEECELLKIVQYSCTTVQMQFEHRKNNPDAPMLKRHCYPFTRLFRRCQEGGIGGRHRTFHVETTAWEGEHKWVEGEKKVDDEVVQEHDGFARYGSYFWSNK